MDRRFAFFDLDHTLLPHDTQVLFCNYILRREGWRRVWLLFFLPCVPLAVLRILSLRTMKRLFLGYLWGMSREELEARVAGFLETDFSAALYPEVVAEVARHRAEGRILVLNSASPEFYLHGIAGRLGFDEVFGTRVVIPDRLPLVPKITGPNNKHGEKITAMRAAGLIAEDVSVLPDSWSYSDSSADLPLLELAGEAVMIHPGAKLAAIGKERGWRTMTPRRPYRGTWGGRVAACLQVLGLYRIPAARKE
jgi:HAD superfamily hydrolase (TIGR01490 family)